MGIFLSRGRKDDEDEEADCREAAGSAARWARRARGRASWDHPDPVEPPTARWSRRRMSDFRNRRFENRIFDGAMYRKRKSKLLDHSSAGPVIRLRILQYMNIVYQKRSLVGEVARMSRRGHVTDRQMDRVKDLMKDYVGALRDLQYMLEPASRSGRTTNVLRNLLYINMRSDSAILEAEGLVPWERAMELRPEDAFDVKISGFAGYGGYSSVNDERTAMSVAYWGRMGVAFLTGLSLIGPMLFMKLYDNLLAQLLTTSVCVLVLGAILSSFEEMQKKDVVGATAAYAAVLVVFVGTTT